MVNSPIRLLHPRPFPEKLSPFSLELLNGNLEALSNWPTVNRVLPFDRSSVQLSDIEGVFKEVPSIRILIPLSKLEPISNTVVAVVYS